MDKIDRRGAGGGSKNRSLGIYQLHNYQSIVILKKLYTRKLPENVENFITNYESSRYLYETDFTNTNLPDLSIIRLARK